MKKIVENYGGEPYEYYPLGQHIVVAPGVCGGRPVFKYTRIEVLFILNHIANGKSIDSILEAFEGRISREGVKEAVSLAYYH